MADAVRRRFRVTGTVQGVGFRPFVYRRAVELGLAGFVRNDSGGVLIEVEGDGAASTPLARALRGRRRRRWPGSRRSSAEARRRRRPADRGFTIEHSDGPRRAGRAGERRHARPARPASPRWSTRPTAATATRSPTAPNCGPRYTIVLGRALRPAGHDDGRLRDVRGLPARVRRPRRPSLPRPAQRLPGVRAARRRGADPDGTAAADGDDAARRRPSARCAPARSWPSRGSAATTSPSTPRRRDGGGRAAPPQGPRRQAVRGDGPRPRRAPSELCDRRRRAAAALTSPRRPIVLAPRRPARDGRRRRSPRACRSSALMLPYSPLHHLLLAGVGRPLVMTSGNLSDEPIAHDDDDAVARLGPLVDGLLDPRPTDPHPLRRLGRRGPRGGGSSCCAGRAGYAPRAARRCRSTRRPRRCWPSAPS